MNKYIVIDLHSNNSVAVVTDEEDRIIFQRRLPNNLNEIKTALATHREETVGVAVESMYNWYWLVDGLMDEGYLTIHTVRTPEVPRKTRIHAAVRGLKTGGAAI